MYADKSAWIITKNVVAGTRINDDAVSDGQQVITKTYTNQLLENQKNLQYSHPDVQLIRKDSKITLLLFYVIDIFSKYVWVIPSKDKKGAKLLMHFQKF